MEDEPTRVRPDVSEPSGRRLSRPYRWLHGLRGFGELDASFAFGLRRLAAVLFTFAVVFGVSFLLLERNLANTQIVDTAALIRADARSFEA